MRNKTKKWTMFLTATAMTACLAVALPSVTASADGEDVTYTEIQSAGFHMEKGAQVRYNAENPGIRFATNVTKAFYESVFDVYPEAASIEFYTEIDRHGNTDGNEVVTVYSSVDFETAFDSADTVQYYGAITYENLDDSLKAQAYAMELEAYAKCRVLDADGNVLMIDVDGTQKPVIIGARRVDSVRSMRLVSSALTLRADYETGFTTGQKDIIEKYLGNINNSTDFNAYETVNESEDGLTCAMDGTITGNYNKVYVNSREVGTVADGVVIFDKAKVDALGLKLGETCTFMLFDDANNVYTSEFMYVTKVLTEATDISVFSVNADRTEHITGYYVLGKDIQSAKQDFDQDPSTPKIYEFHTKYPGAIWYSAITVGFAGTLDGRGYQWRIEGPTEAGLFAYLAGGATIKNISFDFYSTQNYQNRTKTGNSVLAADMTNKSGEKVNIENTYIKISHNAYADHASTPYNKTIIFNRTACLYMENVVVENTLYKSTATSGVSVNGGALFFSDGGRGSLTDEVYQDSRFQNVYVIAGTADEAADIARWGETASEKRIVAGNDTQGTAMGTYKNVNRYATLADLYATFAESNPLPWNLVNGALVWNK